MPGLVGLSPLSTGHPIIFQHYPVRASIRFYSNFTLPMDRSPGFGSTPYYLKAHFRLAFASAPTSSALTLQHKVTRRLILQKACGHSHMELPHFVSLRFQVLFHSPSGVLFTFPSRYSFTIGHRGVFSLTGWSPQIPTRLHVPDRTQEIQREIYIFRLRDYHPLWRDFPDSSTRRKFCNSLGPFRRPCRLLQPLCYNALKLSHRQRFGLFPVRSPLLREWRFLSLPRGTKMFQFPRFASLAG